MQRIQCFLILFILTSAPYITAAQDHTSIMHGGVVQAVTYSPIDSQLIASAGGGHAIKLWDLEEDTVTILGNHTKTINAIAFSPDGKKLVSGSDDYTIKLWDIEKQSQIVTLRHVTDFAQSQIKKVSFSPNGQMFATAGYHVKLWDIHTYRELMTFRHNKWVFALAFSHDGRFLAIGDASGKVRIRNVQNRMEVANFQADADLISALQFSPDNQILASAGYNSGVKLWRLSNWEHIGTLPTKATVTDLNFSTDGMTLATTDYEAVNLWNITDGANIATFLGHKGWVNSASFSPDNSSLISGGDDGTLRLWDVTTYQTVTEELVRLIYFVPNDRSPQSGIRIKLNRMLKDVQTFYADQMEANGFARKTFTFETDEGGNVLVHQVRGRFNDAHYYADTSNKITNELSSRFEQNKHVNLIFVETGVEAVERNSACGIGGTLWIDSQRQTFSRGGYAVIPASGDCFDGDVGKYVVAHELGHAFGLTHDFRDDKYIMSYGNNADRFSMCATEWLNVNRFFNIEQTAFNEPTTVQMLTSEVYPSNAENHTILFQITDLDGIYQVQLHVPTTGTDPATGTKLHSCQKIESLSSTVHFDITSLTRFPYNSIVLQIIDVYGNITRHEFLLKSGASTSVENRTDINGDGTVDTDDLVLVAANFGKTIIGDVFPNPDVNRDGEVNVIDLLLVVNALDITSGAAPLHPHQIAQLDAETVKRWIKKAEQLPNRNVTVRKGIAILQQFVQVLHPIQTRLLENYPNPFNPETWIPYQLESPSDVTVSIYDMNGHRIRTMELGHQRAGTYYSKDRAAYWDGRNDSGELVASGLYFCTLSTGDFTATRKMLLRK
ncbi:T9SS type A sorting domain-containing protein [Candidatus Poribacteria bacterium]|nr:T9SS type A sorting domain-containing protein [Candidatus Poribacteria bacterium]